MKRGLPEQALDPGQGRQDISLRTWIKANGLTRVMRRRFCQHILRKTPCPLSTRYAECQRNPYDILDHGHVWQRADGTRCLLAHVYSERVTSLRHAQEWAAERGMVVTSDPDDGWYGFGTMPLRYELSQEQQIPKK